MIGKPLYCVFDDRADSQPGIRLLIGTLIEQDPSARVCLFFDQASDALAEWISTLENVDLRNSPFPNGLGYDTKPEALLHLLESGEPHVVWLDSDLVITHDPAPLFEALDACTVAITEDALWGRYDDGAGNRARAWGFKLGRTFPFCLNSCVVRVTPEHLELLRAWRDCLSTPEYRDAQAAVWHTRPDHLAGDQDVITALLCSEEFSKVPVRILRRGQDIIQAFGLKGYTVSERVRGLIHGLPPFIHAQGAKPWRESNENWLSRVNFDVSPYVLYAALPHRFGAELPDIFAARTSTGALLRAIGFGSIPLTGLPLAAALSLAYWVKRVIRGVYR